MAKFGPKSQKQLGTIEPSFQEVLRVAIKITDFSILEGHRPQERQEFLYKKGASSVQWPKSKHNSIPAKGGDFAPYPIRWPDIETDTKWEFAKNMGRFFFMAGVIIAVGFMLGVKLRWGGTFKSLFDGPHIEMVD